MKIFLTVLLISISMLSGWAAVHVNGYTRKDGTYVAPHMRSSPNGTTADNYSTKGNVNPYTGEPGTKNAADSGLAPSGISEIPTGGLVEGYVQNSDITRGLELQEGARIYSAPSKDATLLAVATSGDKTVVRGLEGDWARIDFHKNRVAPIAIGAMANTPWSAATVAASDSGIQKIRKAPVFSEVQASAVAGHSDAQFQLGMLFYRGEGVVKNDGDAVIWWGKAAEQGNANAQYNLGLMHKYGESDVEARRLFLLAASQGHVDAQYNLGLMCENGLGGLKDYSYALKLYRLASEQKNPEAQVALGTMYLEGRGIAADSVEAIRLYTLAAEQGYVSAAAWLGQYYAKGGDVIQKNLVQAHLWSNIASAQGHKVAKGNMDAVELEMTHDQITEAMELARRLLEKQTQK